MHSSNRPNKVLPPQCISVIDLRRQQSCLNQLQASKNQLQYSPVMQRCIQGNFPYHKQYTLTINQHINNLRRVDISAKSKLIQSCLLCILGQLSEAIVKFYSTDIVTHLNSIRSYIFCYASSQYKRKCGGNNSEFVKSADNQSDITSSSLYILLK